MEVDKTVSPNRASDDGCCSMAWCFVNVRADTQVSALQMSIIETLLRKAINADRTLVECELLIVVVDRNGCIWISIWLVSFFVMASAFDRSVIERNHFGDFLKYFVLSM